MNYSKRPRPPIPPTERALTSDEVRSKEKLDDIDNLIKGQLELLGALRESDTPTEVQHSFSYEAEDLPTYSLPDTIEQLMRRLTLQEVVVAYSRDAQMRQNELSVTYSLQNEANELTVLHSEYPTHADSADTLLTPSSPEPQALKLIDTHEAYAFIASLITDRAGLSTNLFSQHTPALEQYLHNPLAHADISALLDKQATARISHAIHRITDPKTELPIEFEYVERDETLAHSELRLTLDTPRSDNTGSDVLHIRIGQSNDTRPHDAVSPLDESDPFIEYVHPVYHVTRLEDLQDISFAFSTSAHPEIEESFTPTHADYQYVIDLQRRVTRALRSTQQELHIDDANFGFEI